MSIVVKKANVSQLPLIRSLSWQTFFDTFQKYNTREDMELFLDKSFNEEAVRKEMDDPANIFLLAYLKKEAVGYAKLSLSSTVEGLEDAEAIEICRIYSVKDKIGSGVGKALMQHCLETGKEMNKKVIWLGVWERNQPAIQFYRRFGFEKFGEHPFVLGTDTQTDWLMKKPID